MKSLFSIFSLAVCLILFSCGKEGMSGGGDSCSEDFVGDWVGTIDCSGATTDNITLKVAVVSGDTLSIDSNGENFQGILDGCTLNVTPKSTEQPIFGTIEVSGTIEIKGADLVFTQNRKSSAAEEVCTFVGAR